MKLTLHRKTDGVAIFIVLISIIFLTGMVYIFAKSMKVEIQLAMNSNNETELEWLGRSGVEMARYALSQELTVPGPGQRFDALNQTWAGGHGETNDILNGFTLTDVALGNGKFSVHITDNERKLNINNAAFNQALMSQALIQMGADASDAPVIIGSIQNWIDGGTHLNGATSEYYQSLIPPYFAKAGPIDDLSELLLIKGITPELYWGPNSTNHPLSKFQQRAVPGGPGGQPNSQMIAVGLADVFTPISSGTLNINTASATTLRMIGMDESSANHLISMRQGADGVDGTEDDIPFSNTGEIVNAGLPPGLVNQFMSYLTVRSSTFDVQVDVEVGTSNRRYHAIVHRNSPRDIQILTFNWE